MPEPRYYPGLEAVAAAGHRPLEPRPEQSALVREAQEARSRVIEAAAEALRECEAAGELPGDIGTAGRNRDAAAT